MMESLTDTTVTNSTYNGDSRQHESEVPEEDISFFPASFAQSRLWFLNEWEPGVYNIPMTVRLTGQMNVAAMENGLSEIIRRHEVLRTTFRVVGGILVQAIAPRISFSMPLLDLQGFPQDVQKMKLRRLIKEEIRKPFDLRRGPLLRATMLKLAPDDHAMMITMHHIVSDAWSMEILFHELCELYTANVYGHLSPLPELPIQYVDYAIWQQNWLQGEVLEEQLNYWKSQLAGIPVLQLPTDRPRPAVQTFRGAAQLVVLPAELTEALRAFSRREGVTLFMTLLAAFKTLLYRYTEQERIVVGIPIAGRTDRKLEGLIGCFINTLALCTNLSGNPTFREVLRRVREVTLGAYDHQDLPFEKLVEELQPERDLSRNPLTQVMFALQNVPRGQVSLPGLTLSALKLDSETAGLRKGDAVAASKQQNLVLDDEPALFDLDLTMWERGDELIGELRYNTDLFDTPTIQRMQQHYLTLLQEIISDAGKRITDFSFLPQQELQQLLGEWNDTAVDYPSQYCFAELFEAQVEQTPGAIAVTCGQEQLTYAELNRRANAVAHVMLSAAKNLGLPQRRFFAALSMTRTFGPDTLVALLAERGTPLLTAILAVFKAGGAYLPLDPHHPPARLRHILEHSKCSIILSTREFAPTLSEVIEQMEPETRPEIVYLDDVYEEGQMTENLPVRNTPGHLAYVIYTSGSTGAPKGVMVEQRGMINHLYAKIDALELTRTDIVAQTASQCFDISVWQMLAPLLVGGSVRIYPDEIAHDPTRLLVEVERDSVSILETVPSLLRAMLEIYEGRAETRPNLRELRWLVPTGEALPADLCHRWLALYPHCPLMNAYGPTECSDDVTHHPIYEVPAEIEGYMPIGRAVNNTQLYVLDRHLRPVPIGVVGELYAGGAGVGRGYLADPRRTAETFIPNPFDANSFTASQSQGGTRLYKTGDLARYRPDGTLEFLGRIDHQVKLRGYRIELGEIETVLGQHPAVRDVVVVAREDVEGDKRLVAYVVLHPEESISFEELQRFVREKLPDYMVPSAGVFMKSLPLTPNGKLDRKALPVPDETRPVLAVAYVAPRTPIEQELAAIWSEILGLERIGLHDDFFDLGGHSLLTVRLVSQIDKQFGKRLPLAAIFQGRTIEALAEMLSRQQHEASLWSPAPETQLPTFDIQSEAALDLAVCPEVWPGELNATPAHILLTGATGFLGALVLAELLSQTSADIYCLVRATNAEEGMEKLERNLANLLLWQPAYRERIKPLPGDLAQPLLGLSRHLFEELANRLDVIYHNGALVNMLYPYSELKASNVLGTQEVIRLAAHGKIKPLHYVSTLSVYSHMDSPTVRRVKEQEPIDEHGVHMRGGYAQSKWVAEKMVTTARSRGLPVAIYRPGRITGHSKTGAWRTDDVLCRMIMGCIQLGSVPMFVASETLEMTPVDYVSQAIVALSKRKASLGQAFHLFNTSTTRVSDLIRWINDSGYEVRQLEYEAWLAELERAIQDSTDNALVPLAPLFPRQAPIEQVPVPKLVFDNRNTLLGLSGTSITCPPGDASLIQTYLSFMVKRGFLQAAGVRSGA
ncbi:MAG TPA: amino acid adenylation domain-containing protein [Ktedonobacteraceae bacterium]|nr:amino acid adenylation domain-containing protein [Ktedonobacteraceae bacterium]